MDSDIFSALCLNTLTTITRLTTVACEATYRRTLRRRDLKVSDVGHEGGLEIPAPGADNAEPVFQSPVGLPSLVLRAPCQKSMAEINLFFWS